MTVDASITIEFTGGMELLFGGQKRLSLPFRENQSIRDLIQLLRNEHLRDKPELFVKDDTVRPGILVLINDVDWELEGEGKYVIQPSDNIVFISTLHGG